MTLGLDLRLDLLRLTRRPMMDQGGTTLVGRGAAFLCRLRGLLPMTTLWMLDLLRRVGPLLLVAMVLLLLQFLLTLLLVRQGGDLEGPQILLLVHLKGLLAILRVDHRLEGQARRPLDRRLARLAEAAGLGTHLLRRMTLIVGRGRLGAGVVVMMAVTLAMVRRQNLSPALLPRQTTGDARRRRRRRVSTD